VSDATPHPEPPAPAGPAPLMGGPAVAGARVADEPDRPGPPSAPATGRRTKRTVIEWVAVLVVAVLAALLLRTFVIQPYFIPSGSMEPTLEIGDKVLVDKLSYHLHSVHRGDVIVFKRPPNYTDPGVKDLIKRVIGLPGETISAQGGQVYINGKLLPEPWLPKEYAYTANFGPVHIPAGDYFVMGDHRGDSDDSRFGLGPISGKLIVGRAFLIVWPIGHIGTL
jgi:signal peptidase I